MNKQRRVEGGVRKNRTVEIGAQLLKKTINHANHPEKCYIFSGFFMGID